MGHADADQMIRLLDGKFRAAIVGMEDAVASDLAFSLSQDVPVVDELLRDGGRVRVDGVAARITRIAHDYVEAGGWLVPLTKAVVTVGGERPPIPTAQVLVGRLRALARAGAHVTIGLRDTGVAGAVLKATPTHLVVRGSLVYAVPLEQIEFVRLSRGGSEGAL